MKGKIFNAQEVQAIIAGNKDKILTQCEKCNGKGEITKTNKQNYGIWGMGFANLVDYLASVSWKETCDKCDGNGVYYINKNKIKKY